MKKRKGRPFKEPTPGKQASLGLLVRADIKRLIDSRAKANGRTQSAEAVAMLERYLALEQMLDVMAKVRTPTYKPLRG